MATSIKIPDFQPITWQLPAPEDEARSMAHLVWFGGASVESVRDLIGVPPKLELTLRLYAQRRAAAHDPLAKEIPAMMKWRRRVLAEFNRLIARAGNRGNDRPLD